jgi:hypothetical protein
MGEIKEYRMKSTCFRAIENAQGDIQLHDLYLDDGSHHNQPCLSFKNVEFEGMWDNSDFLLKFFRGIKKYKKKSLKVLKIFCKENKLDYESTLKDLLDIYADAKKLKFFKPKKDEDKINKT